MTGTHLVREPVKHKGMVKVTMAITPGTTHPKDWIAVKYITNRKRNTVWSLL
jgi:hypothetical protein